MAEEWALFPVKVCLGHEWSSQNIRPNRILEVPKNDILKSKIICKFAQLQIFFRELIQLFMFPNTRRTNKEKWFYCMFGLVVSSCEVGSNVGIIIYLGLMDQNSTSHILAGEGFSVDLVTAVFIISVWNVFSQKNIQESVLKRGKHFRS